MSRKPESSGPANLQSSSSGAGEAQSQPVVRKHVNRAERLSSHALVDIKTNRWNPFSRRSAVLLDLSSSGFKVEFTSSVNLAIQAPLYFRLPLFPFGICKPAELRLVGKVLWFDANTMRAGGTFQAVGPQMEHAVRQVIAALEKKTG